ncbi:MAG: hypothetical protein BGO98_27985 [Myxococcales bacterium 68-20]|nr:IS5 family transposase [Myxococcales bacterium]OJY30553.1 MAG: hypothetical protein BGO98_27985 [Myxococcales bacterium 68-20]
MGGARQFFDAQRWRRIAPVVTSLARRGSKGDLRSFLEAVAWILRTGAPWRDLAKRFGPWGRICRRYRRWAVAGRWESLRTRMSPVEQRGFLLIDSTIVKAHPHAAGARREGGLAKSEGLGRSRGGFTTKLHAVVSERGSLVRYVLTGGEAHDITQAETLVASRDGVGVGGVATAAMLVALTGGRG